MNVTFLDANHPHWSRKLEQAGVLLGAGVNPLLFPYHFLYVTLSKIGGKLAFFEEGATTVGVGFLFPRRLSASGEGARRTYTLRFHPTPGAVCDPQVIMATCQQAMPDAAFVYYDPQGARSYYRTSEPIGVVDIGRPDAAEAAASREIQRQVWGSPDEFLYPSDIHSAEFAAGTSLVARVEDKTAGFLFGFYTFGGAPLPADWTERFNGGFRIESQTLGVLSDYRGLRIANLLKKRQAELAWREGVGVVSWTADPLQAPNAALNFGLLKAVAFEFAPDLYPFRNELNRVHASRFGLTWLVGSKRVRDTPAIGARADILDLARRPQIPRANSSCDDARFNLDADVIAIETPADWTALQACDPAQAQAWRTLTDAVLKHYIGLAPGQYTVTGVGVAEERRFLLAERSDNRLWQRLGA
jgi:predicted GNAT superfamily acetyltransferase